MFFLFPFRPLKCALTLMALALMALALTASASWAQEAPAPPEFASLHLRPLPLAKWLAEDKMTVISSPHDIGEIANVFDGNFATVLRSAGVNPQRTTVQFDETVSVAAVRVVTSDPQDRWKIEGVVWSADGKSAKTEIVPWTNVAFETGTVNEIVFPRNLAVSELTLTLERINGDDFVHLHEWELLTEIKEPQAPN